MFLKLEAAGQCEGFVIPYLSTTNAVCNGKPTGSAVADASFGNGTAPYKYTYTNTNGLGEFGPEGNQNYLAAGHYILKVTDANQCVATREFDITEPPPISAIISSQKDATCGLANGGVVITPAEGVEPYVFRWSDDLPHGSSPKDLAAQKYTVTITDANRCEHLENITIKNVGGVKASVSHSTNASCFGTSDGSATVDVKGTGNYIYAWSPSGGDKPTANNLVAGKYTVLVKDEFGCSDEASIEITQPEEIPATVKKVDATCGKKNGEASVAITNPSGDYTYLWTPGDYNSQSIKDLASGTYAVKITNEKGCIKKDIVIRGQPAPKIESIEQTDVLCYGRQNGSAKATVSGGTGGYTYVWSNGKVEYSGNPLKNIAAGKYSLIVTDGTGCSATNDVTISQPAPLANVVKTTAATCGNPNGTATITESGGTAPYTYTWNVAGQNEASASGLAAGNYEVYIYDQNHCEDKARVTIASTGKLTVAIRDIVNVRCNGGNNGSATAYPTGAAPYTYSWSGVDEKGQTASNLSAGDYTVTVTDHEGCTTTAPAHIAEPTPVTTQVTSVATTCGSNNGSAKVIATGGTGNYTFNWQPGDYTKDEISNVAGDTYTVTVKDANGCAKTGVAIIKSSSSIAISSIVPSDALCNGQSSGSATATVTGGSANYTYEWTNGGVGYAGNPVKDVPAGTYQLTVTDAAGCNASGSVTIRQPAPLTHTVKTTPATCGNPNGAATITESGGTGPYTYGWTSPQGNEASVSGLVAGDYVCRITDSHQCEESAPIRITNLGGVSATITNTRDVTCHNGNNGSATVSASGSSGPFTYAWSSQAGSTATVDNLKPGNYTVTVTDQQGCTAAASTYVAQPAGLKTTVTSTNTTCNNNNGSAMIVAEGGTTPYSYAWHGPNQTTSTISNLAAGHYVVTVKDGKGCSAIDSAVIAPSTNPVIDITYSNVLCHGNQDGTATANVSGGLTPYSYSWKSGSKTFTTPAIEKLAVGTYELKVTDAAGCLATANTTIAEPTELNLSFAATHTTCGSNNGSAILSADGGTIPYKYQWSTGSRENVASGLAAGSYYVSCTDANGCVVSAKDIKINPSTSPKISLGRDTTICPGTELVLYPGNFKSYRWQDNTSSATCKVQQTSLYAVTVTDSTGCTASASVKVEVNCRDVVFPNAFTPNGDGHNDAFGPLGTVAAVKDYTLTIYNRWGQRVFSTTDPYKKWDGKFNASDGGTGTYVWIATYSFNSEPKRVQKGTIMVVK